MKEGDVVLMCDSDHPRNRWPLALISKVYPSKDQLVRKVQCTIVKDDLKKTYDRPIHKLVLLISAEDR